MSRETSAPTVENVKGLANDAKTHWMAFHQQAEEDFSLYVDGPKVIIKDADGELLESTNPDTAKSKSDSAANHLIANFPTITIDKAAFPESEREKADSLEQALQAVFWRSTSGETADPHRGSILNAATAGMGVIQIAVDFSDQPEEPDSEDEEAKRDHKWRKKNFFPVTLLSVDPREIFPDPGTDGEKWVVRQGKMSVGDVMATFDGWCPKNSDGTARWEFDTVDYMEWQSRDWYYFEVDGQPVERIDALNPEVLEENKARSERNAEYAEMRQAGELGIVDEDPYRVAGPWKNPLGFIPYVVFQSGYGAASGKPEHRYMGLITSARKGGLFRAEARRMTQLDQIVDKMAWGAQYGPPVAGGTLQMGPGAYNEVQPDANGNLPEIRTIGLVNPPTGLFAELAQIRGAIDQSTLSSVLDSAESGSAESALKFVRKTQEALVALNPLKSNAERAWVRVFQRLIKFFDNPHYFGEDESVSIWGNTPTGSFSAEIGPKIIKGRHIPVYIDIRPALPEDEAVRIQTGLAGLGRGFSLHDFYDKFARFDNPAAAEKRLYKDQIKQQVIQSGVIAQYLSAVMTGQANPVQGVRGFMSAQTGVGTGEPGAAEPTSDLRSSQPQVSDTAEASNPGTTDAMGEISRLLQARARQPKAA